MSTSPSSFEEKVLEKLGKLGLEAGFQRPRRLWVRVPLERLVELLLDAKEELGYEHLVQLACVDWLEEGEFELVYHLWHYQERTQLSVKTRVSREKPEVPSTKHIWARAGTYERELHEMFGINFPGNDDLSHLILEEGWPPEGYPMRRDFNTRKFVEEMFGVKDRSKELFQE